MAMILVPSPFTVRHFISGASRKGFSPDDPVKVQMVTGLPELSKLMFLQPSLSDQELRTLNLPILLLLGDHEMMYQPQQALERAMQIFPRVQTELILDAGHFLPADQPEQVNQKLLDFFQRNP
jgi:pimeloyl-ACP methyl ester carboxylesterase